MKLSGWMQQVVKALDVAINAPPVTKSHHPHSRRIQSDGFEVSRKPVVNLGKPTGASAAADGEYVKSLYRDLLHREPDAAGFQSHLNGLQNGMSRDEIRQVFLNSPEFRQLQNGPAQVPAAPVVPTQATGVEQLKQLISADIKTAYGRDATEADFGYWLPKLQAPCDSGFVTSGQMTGTEYYHRRMLGWQAGGSDVATSGPYAGSPDAHGPVPSATDVVGPVPSATDVVGPISTPTSPSSAGGPSTEQLRGLIAADIKTASGGSREASERDYSYWLPMLQSPCDSGFVTSGQMTGVEYYHRRMLGWQAGGSDAATGGPYAGTPDARGPVPSATEVISQL